MRCGCGPPCTLAPPPPAANGLSGDGPVRVGRLLASAPLRRALAATSGPLAVAVSEPLYRDAVVAARCTRWTPEDFREVAVHEKETHEPAWLITPLAGDVHTLDLAEAGEAGESGAAHERRSGDGPAPAASAVPAAPEPSRTEPADRVGTVMNGGAVFNGPVNFGISK